MKKLSFIYLIGINFLTVSKNQVQEYEWEVGRNHWARSGVPQRFQIFFYWTFLLLRTGIYLLFI